MLLLNKKKDEHTEYHGIYIPFKSLVYTEVGVPLFSFLGYEAFGKVFSENSNLSNLIGIQS